MAVCPACAAANADGARFCASCGARLEAAGEPLELRVRRRITVVFCDLIGSTSLGERHDPERLSVLVGRYFEEMERVLARHGGTVEKFIGDAVMAVFGVPVAHEDDALRAVRAAAEMRDALATLNDELERTHGVRLSARIGVNSGEVVAGDATRGHGFVTGDAVNVAKRLEEVAPPNEIVLGAETYALVRHAVVVEPLESFALKGKEHAVEGFRLVDVSVDATTFARRLDSPLVGRARELAELETLYAAVTSNRTCHIALVLGAAGIGKSRLAQELVAQVEPSAHVLRGRCLPYGEGVTFAPIAQALRGALALEDGRLPPLLLPDPEERARVEARVAALLGAGPVDHPTEEVFWGVRRLLEALAREQPLVVLFDDIHWAEPTFLDLVEYLEGWTRDAPILLCCLARPDLLELRPEWARLDLLELGPLADDAGRAIVRALVADEESAERLVRTAGGNPLFLEQLAVMADEEGGVVSAIPPTIHALLDARLDRLEPVERVVIERASVAGQSFSWGEISDLVPASVRPSLTPALQSLVRRDLLRPGAPHAYEDVFAFSHGLVRDAAYASLPKEVRAELHERFARRLEGRGGDVEPLVGFHLEQAVRFRRELGIDDAATAALAGEAARQLARCGRDAHEHGDAPAAVGLLGRALALGPDEDVTLRLEHAVALREAGRIAEADEELGAVAAEAADERVAARARVERAQLGVMLGADPAGMLEEAERAIAVFEPAGDEAGLARAWRLVAFCSTVQWQSAAAATALERALAHARAAGDRRFAGAIQAELAAAEMLGPTPVDAASERCERLLAEAQGDRLREGLVLGVLATLEAMGGALEPARERFGRAVEIVEGLGRQVPAAVLHGWRGLVELQGGNAATAEAELRPALELLERLGERSIRTSIAAYLADALLAQGRDEEAAQIVDAPDAAAMPAATGAVWCGARASLAARRGELDAAEALAREAAALADTTDCLSLRGQLQLRLADVLLHARRPDEAQEAARSAARLFEQKGNVLGVTAARAAVSRANAGGARAS